MLPRLRRHLQIPYSQLLHLLLGLLGRYLPVIKVDFVTQQQDEALARFVIVEEVHPHLSFCKTGLGGHIEDHQRAMCVLQVTRDQRTEALLPSSIPKLKTIIFASMREVFGEEIDSDSGLGEGGVHWQISQNDHGCISR